MDRVLDAGRARPLYDCAAVRRIEAAAQAALSPHTLMQRAGAAVARLAIAVAPHARRVLVLAGPGNNGGDGFEAAWRLRQAGRDVRIACPLGHDKLPADAQASLARARQAGVTIESGPPSLDGAELVIDALLGLGASRPPQGALADAIAAICACTGQVLAIDLPTGIDPDTGAVLGERAVRATHTLSLLVAKPGLFTAEGRDHAGEVWLDTLGIECDGAAPSAQLTGAPLRQTRRHAQHKGSFGDVQVVGGAPGMVGAALLAGRAALAAGAGRVHVELLAGHGSFDSDEPGLMLRGADGLRADDVAVVGCGGGDLLSAPLPGLLRRASRLVLDADALNAVALEPALQKALQARSAARLPTLLTPHPLEAARLLGTTTAAVQSNRLSSAQSLADRFGCAVLLKGSGSVSAAPGRTPFINPTGNALLATAGTGDVLAGYIAGRWAQTDADVLTVAAESAWLHGHAADLAAAEGRRGALRASELVERLAAL